MLALWPITYDLVWYYNKRKDVCSVSISKVHVDGTHQCRSVTVMPTILDGPGSVCTTWSEGHPWVFPAGEILSSVINYSFLFLLIL